MQEVNAGTVGNWVDDLTQVCQSAGALSRHTALSRPAAGVRAPQSCCESIGAVLTK